MEHVIRDKWQPSSQLLKKRLASINTAKNFNTSLIEAAIKSSYALGVLEKNSGHYLKALKCFEQTVMLDPDNWQAYAQLCVVNAMLGNLENTISCLIVLEELSERVTKFHVTNLLHKEEWECIISFLEGLKDKPNHPELYLLGLPIACLFQGKRNPLLELFNEPVTEDLRSSFAILLEKIISKSDIIFRILGRVQHENMQYEAALESFNISICLNPFCARTYTLRSNSYRVLSVLDKSEIDCRTAVALAPESIEAIVSTGLLQFELENYEHAIRCYTLAAKLDEQYQKVSGNKYLFPEFGKMKCNVKLVEEKKDNIYCTLPIAYHG